MVAAGHDQVVSTPAIENFGGNLLAGRISSSPAPSTRSCRSRIITAAQFWAAFDAFVPGTPLY